MDDAALEKLAIEEIYRELALNSGSPTTANRPTKSTNKRFLGQTLKAVVSHNKRVSSQTRCNSNKKLQELNKAHVSRSRLSYRESVSCARADEERDRRLRLPDGDEKSNHKYSSSTKRKDEKNIGIDKNRIFNEFYRSFLNLHSESTNDKKKTKVNTIDLTKIEKDKLKKKNRKRYKSSKELESKKNKRKTSSSLSIFPRKSKRKKRKAKKRRTASTSSSTSSSSSSSSSSSDEEECRTNVIDLTNEK